MNLKSKIINLISKIKPLIVFELYLAIVFITTLTNLLFASNILQFAKYLAACLVVLTYSFLSKK